jgi:tetratricopeptide (TPR) repeat protein
VNEALEHDQSAAATELFRRGRFAEAVRLLEPLAQGGDAIGWRAVLAEAYFHAGDYEASRRTIESLQAEGTDTPVARIGRAAIDALTGLHESALARLELAEAMPEVSARDLNLIGQLCLRLRSWSDAERTFQAALAKDDALADAHDGLAMALLLQGSPQGAERHAREAVQLEPANYTALVHLGVVLLRLERYQESIAVLQQAVSCDESGPACSAHRHLAEALERSGKQALAVHHRALACRGSSGRKQPPHAAWFNHYSPL